MPVRLRVRELAEQQGLTLSRFQLEAKLPMSTARRFWYSSSDGSAHGPPLKQINLDVLDAVAQFFGLAPGDLLEHVEAHNKGLEPQPAGVKIRE